MTPVPDDRVQRTYRVRVALFLIGSVLIVLLLSYLYQDIQPLMRWPKSNAIGTNGSGPPM
jgi:hypothetical protein